MTSAPPSRLVTTRYIKLYFLLGIALSCILIPFCVHLLNSDHFALTILLFPLPIAAILNIGGENVTFCVLASFQFPLYGLFLGFGQGNEVLRSSCVALVIAHIVCLAFCLMSFL